MREWPLLRSDIHDADDSLPTASGACACLIINSSDRLFTTLLFCAQ